MSRLYFLFLLIPAFSWANSNEDQLYLNEVRHLEADIERIRNEVAEINFEQQELEYRNLLEVPPGTLYAIRIDGDEISDPDLAEEISQRAGYKIMRKLQSFKNTYIAERLTRRKRNVDDFLRELIAQRSLKWAEQLKPLDRFKRKSILTKGAPANAFEAKPSMKIDEAWKLGLSGKEVNVAILDDGIDYLHLDLLPRFNREISFDFVKDRPDPFPEHGDDFGHGTQCSGVIGMHPKLAKCGVGVASGSRIGALKTLGESELLNDALEADALAFQSEQVDILSASWGPKDDGKTAEKPGKLAQEALKNGAKMGRHGLGTLYVWASGNGGLVNDTCAMDGYASNIHTLTFGSVSEDGSPAHFSEPCSAILATVAGGDRGVKTTSLSGTCSAFSGSSATAPIAAGILALGLEANPKLTQRDVQHLIVHTSNPNDLKGAWKTNGAGLKFSDYHGFGLFDAEKFVKTAKTWKNIGEEHKCFKTNPGNLNGRFTPESPLTLEILMDGCRGTSSEIKYIERIALTVNATHKYRGAISIELISPQGTRDTLLKSRINDISSNSINGFALISTHFWGEDPHGKWTLIVSEEPSMKSELGGSVNDWNLTILGTSENFIDLNPHISNT